MTVKLKKKKTEIEEGPKEIALEQIPEVNDQCLEISGTEGLEGKSQLVAASWAAPE